MTEQAPSLAHIEDRYEILQKLQEGGMGAIYKVRERSSGEIRVVKTVHPHHATNETLRRRFRREAESATRLQHKNLARFFDFHTHEVGEGQEALEFMVLEFIDGLTLNEVLKRRRPPSLGLALEIADQALGGLAYLHGQGFVHRDVAPDNIMVTTAEDGSLLVKLIDLGVAKEEGGGASLTRAGTFLGKIRYSAPEGFSGDSKKLTARSDLYSFGAVLYELLTGSLAVPGKNFSEIVSGHLFKAPLDFATSDPQGRLSPPLRDALLAALEKDPEKRVHSAEDLRRRLASERQGLEAEPGELAEILNATAPTAPPPAIQSLLANARLLLQLESRTEARRRLEQILVQEPEHEEALRLLSRLPKDPPKPSEPAALPVPKAKPRIAAPTVADTPLPSSPADEAVVAMERSLRLGDLDEARKQLDLAIAYYGDRPAYARIAARIVRAEKASPAPLEGDTEPVDTIDPEEAQPRPRQPRWVLFAIAGALLAMVLLTILFFVL